MSQAKRKILASALESFMNKGVESTTISDIRRISGISVGSIYHHFANKDGIVVALFLTGMQDHSSLQEQSLAEAETAEQGVKSIVRCYINWINDNPDWARFTFRYRSLVENSQRADENEEHKRAHFNRLKGWFAPHIEAKLLQKLPFEVYHSLIIGPSQDYALRWLAGKTKGALVNYRELYAEAAWQAIKL